MASVTMNYVITAAISNGVRRNGKKSAFEEETHEKICKRTPQQDDFYHLMDGKFCGEAWDAVSRYV
jgi:hypothetical protein